MIKQYIKVLLNLFFYINLNVFKCYSSDKYLENRYFTMSFKKYIIDCIHNLTNIIDKNDFINGKLDINKINEDEDISKLLENDEGELKFSPKKKITIKTFLSSCSDIYDKKEYYEKYYEPFNEKFKEMENDKKYKVADMFLKLLIIELDYEKKTNETFEKYLNNNSENFKKMRSSNKEFFEKYYGAKFFYERAKALIIVNTSLLNSIKLMIENFKDKDKDKDKVLDFIIAQTYNKIVNIDYLWILYTYGYRASKTLSDKDDGYIPFPSNLFKDNFS